MRIILMNNSPLMKYGVAEGLEELGHEVLALNAWQEYKNHKGSSCFDKVFHDFQPDAFMTEGFPGFPAIWVQRLKNLFHLPHLYWAIEDPVLHEQAVSEWIPCSDYIFTTTVELLDTYRSLGKPAELLLFACSKRWHKQVEPSPQYKTDIVFVGSNYDIREQATAQIVKPLLDSGYKVQIHGNSSWLDAGRTFNLSAYPHVYKGILPYEELDRAYSSAKIVLGLQCVENSLSQTSMRTFEALGCGAFYLTQYTPAHEHLFQIGKELEVVREGDNIVDKVFFYLENDDLRRKIAAQGQAKVYREHTYTHRAEQIVRAVESLKEAEHRKFTVASGNSRAYRSDDTPLADAQFNDVSQLFLPAEYSAETRQQQDTAESGEYEQHGGGQTFGNKSFKKRNFRKKSPIVKRRYKKFRGKRKNSMRSKRSSRPRPRRRVSSGKTHTLNMRKIKPFRQKSIGKGKSTHRLQPARKRGALRRAETSNRAKSLQKSRRFRNVKLLRNKKLSERRAI